MLEFNGWAKRIRKCALDQIRYGGLSTVVIDLYVVHGGEISVMRIYELNK